MIAIAILLSACAVVGWLTDRGGDATGACVSLAVLAWMSVWYDSEGA